MVAPMISLTEEEDAIGDNYGLKLLTNLEHQMEATLARDMGETSHTSPYVWATRPVPSHTYGPLVHVPSRTFF